MSCLSSRPSSLLWPACTVFSNDPNIVRYAKDLCMLLVWISALVIAIATAARQIPVERENRTIFPLLAKPVTRWQVVLGKFMGSWLATGVALLVFYIFFGLATGSREEIFAMAGLFSGLLVAVGHVGRCCCHDTAGISGFFSALG